MHPILSFKLPSSTAASLKQFQPAGKTSTLFRILLISLCFCLFLAACGSGAKTNTPAAAVEAYLNALVTKDANRLVNLSCTNWEAQAKQELDSFAAVQPSLKDLACQESSKEGNTSLVKCSGKIVANYNGEDVDIKLDDRLFQATDEGGEWRMCGYR